MSTPAIRVLDAAGASYRLHEYDLDPAAESYGLEAAAKLGLPPERVLKTLVVAVAGDHVLALVPVDERLEPKALGETIVLNAGRRGLQVELAPVDVLELTGGRAQRLTSRG